AARQREDRFQEFGEHWRRCHAAILRRLEPRWRNARRRRDGPIIGIERRADPPQGQMGRGGPRETEASPGTLEGRREERAWRWHFLLRGHAVAFRRSTRQGPGRRTRGGNPRMDRAFRRLGSRFGSSGLAISAGNGSAARLEGGASP